MTSRALSGIRSLNITKSTSTIRSTSILTSSSTSSSSKFYSTSSNSTQPFFPVQSSPNQSSPIITTIKPLSSLWYTAKPSLNETLTSLSNSITATRKHLFKSGLLSSISVPLNAPDKEFRDVLPHPRLRRWMGVKEMSTYLKTGTDLRSSQYKKLTSLLSNLEGLLPYAEIADSLSNNNSSPTITMDPVGKATGRGDGQALGGMSLLPQLETLLSRFQQPATISASGITIERVVGKDRKLGAMDSFGRVMAVGRRKESGARVWIVPVSASNPSSELTSSTPSSTTSPLTLSPDSIPGRVVINTRSIAEYFSLPTHRSAAILPLSLTSTLGSFNVFGIVRGGGLAAQSEAVAMGLARALVEWEGSQVELGTLEEGAQGWRETLKKGKLFYLSIIVSPFFHTNSIAFHS